MQRPVKLSSNPFVLVGVLALAIIATVTVAAAVQSEDRRQVRRFATWFIEGPACPGWKEGKAASRLDRVFAAEGVTIARQHGHMACLPIQDHGGRGPGRVLACHMLSPGLLEVVAPSGTYRFDPGPGGPATVLVDAKSARCVARANTRLAQPSSTKAYD